MQLVLFKNLIQGNFDQQRYPSRQGEKQIIDVDVDKELKTLGQPSRKRQK